MLFNPTLYCIYDMIRDMIIIMNVLYRSEKTNYEYSKYHFK